MQELDDVFSRVSGPPTVVPVRPWCALLGLAAKGQDELREGFIGVVLGAGEVSFYPPS